MAHPECSGSSRMGIEKLALDHTVALPMALLEPSIPFVSPWFTNSTYNQMDIFFRIGMDSWVDQTDGYGYSTGPARNVWLQLATESEMVRLKMDPYVKTLTNVTGKRTDLFPCKIEVVIKKLPSATVKMSLSPPKQLTTLECINLTTTSGYQYLRQAEFSNWQEGELDIAVSIEVMRPVVLTNSCANVLPRTLLPSGSVPSCACDVLQQMLSRNLCSDVVLKMEGEKLAAHKAVLAANSQVFEAMFKDHTKESKEGEVEIQDISADVMSVALKYMYGGDISKSKPSVLSDLLSTAEKYELLGLKEFCEESLMESSSIDVVQLLCLADTHNATKLRSTALRRIANNPKRKEIINDSTVKRIMKSHPSVVADLLKALV